MRTKEEILNEFTGMLGYKLPVSHLQLIYKAMQEYASQFSGSEPEGKEAVELLRYIRDNHFSIGDDGLWYNNSLDYMVLTDEQLIENYKIWKERAIK